MSIERGSDRAGMHRGDGAFGVILLRVAQASRRAFVNTADMTWLLPGSGKALDRAGCPSAADLDLPVATRDRGRFDVPRNGTSGSDQQERRSNDQNRPMHA
ncbi:hypothetical protein [Microvirga massiliensis]|uniref:hypothetical protein n=1 Tax=Microvirga massiliensis TaxID=1033741 RepID=UPI00062B92FB|nr:hypothetical protein [Microvirga massiliensis]